MHRVENPHTAKYEDFTCKKCETWAKGTPSTWWRDYALIHWEDEEEMASELCATT